MPERLARGLLDTSVVIDLEHIEPDALPRELAVSIITMAELSAGPGAARDLDERARRQDRLQRAEAVFDPLPLDIDGARAYGRIHAAVLEQGHQPRRRFAGLLIAAAALAGDLPLVTRNPDEFVGLEQLVTIVAV